MSEVSLMAGFLAAAFFTLMQTKSNLKVTTNHLQDIAHNNTSATCRIKSDWIFNANKPCLVPALDYSAVNPNSANGPRALSDCFFTEIIKQPWSHLCKKK